MDERRKKIKGKGEEREKPGDINEHVRRYLNFTQWAVALASQKPKGLVGLSPVRLSTRHAERMYGVSGKNNPGVLQGVE